MPEHAIEKHSLSGVNGKMESRRDEIDLAAQDPDSIRKRFDAYEATATLPYV
jgi:hypothetical protein